MAKRNNQKVSIRTLDKILKCKTCHSNIEDCGDYQAIIYSVDNESPVEITVKKILSLAEVDSFVEAASNGGLVVGDEGETRFSPAMSDYAYYLSLVTFFTNLKTDVGPDRIYSMVYASDMMSTIESCVNQRQLLDLKRYIKSLSDFNIQVGIHYSASKTQALINKIDTITSAIGAITEPMREVSPEKLQEAITNLSGASEDKIIRLMQGGDVDSGPAEATRVPDR